MTRQEWLVALIRALRKAILELASETTTSVKIGTTQYTLANLGELRKMLSTAEDELSSLVSGVSRSRFIGLRFGGVV